MPIVEALHVYPVKSCRAVALDRAEVTRTGLAGDRLFQVVDGSGEPITQRQQPQLATVQPAFVERGIRLDSDAIGPIEVARPTVADTTVRSLLGTPVAAADAGDEAAAWFSELVGSVARLVAMTDASENVLPIPGLQLETSFADAAGVLVVNAASLEWLATRADEPFGMERFRPNVTVAGVAAWEEDTWRRFRVGEAQLGGGIAWPRCAIPQVDQRTGERRREPARVLRRTRWCADAPSVDNDVLRSFLEGNALFGIGCWAEPLGATIDVGDPVDVFDVAAPVVAPPLA